MFLHSRAGFALTVVVALIGLMLLIMHRNHLGDSWPFLLLLVFAGMHLFGHGGHGGHGGHDAKETDTPTSHQHPGNGTR